MDSNQLGISALKSKNFDSFKVYIIKCYNDNESFYKIGRTYTTLYKRFNSRLPYSYVIIHEYIFNTAKDAFNMETELKRKYKQFKYLPFISFGGQFECFSEINL